MTMNVAIVIVTVAVVVVGVVVIFIVIMILIIFSLPGQCVLLFNLRNSFLRCCQTYLFTFNSHRALSSWAARDTLKYNKSIS